MILQAKKKKKKKTTATNLALNILRISFPTNYILYGKLYHYLCVFFFFMEYALYLNKSYNFKTMYE